MRPVLWSIAGNDSGGGAGLSADQRVAEAFGVHMCPVVAAVTAQNSQAVTRVDAVSAQLLDAQLAALADDLPPAAIKTGLLGSAENVAVVARWVDRLRERAPVALVVDPVLSASSGAVFADDAVLAAYRTLLLPRATLLTPNRSEMVRLLPGAPADDVPQQARAARAAGASACVITGGDAEEAASWARDWLDAPQATGWLALPRQRTRHTHGTGCTFASAAASALALGFVVADAVVLAKMATAQALLGGKEAGAGAGPVRAMPGFARVARHLPLLSWGDEALPAAPAGAPRADWPPLRQDTGAAGLYAIVDSLPRLQQVLRAGAACVQLRIKAPADPDPGWRRDLRETLAAALAACRARHATLVVNDHWPLALELAGSDSRGLALHLGQEDLAALSSAQRQQLRAGALPLGVSSHSLWELARARSLNPWYVACGPVWPTLTKAMPWRAQGLHNLAWWVHMAGVPVVAIGGILEHAQAAWAARSGAAAVCVVRGLGADPGQSWPHWRAAVQSAAGLPRLPVPLLPQPTLEPDHAR